MELSSKRALTQVSAVGLAIGAAGCGSTSAPRRVATHSISRHASTAQKRESIAVHAQQMVREAHALRRVERVGKDRIRLQDGRIVKLTRAGEGVASGTAGSASSAGR
jgi:hypothetical protein